MKVKDLPKSAKLSDIKVDLIPLIKDQEVNTGLKEGIGYLIGGWDNGVWVKTDKTDKRIYPIFGEFSKEDILNLDVIEE